MDGPEGGIGMKSCEGELRENNRAPDGPKWTAQSTRWRGLESWLCPKVEGKTPTAYQIWRSTNTGRE